LSFSFDSSIVTGQDYFLCTNNTLVNGTRIYPSGDSSVYYVIQKETVDTGVYKYFIDPAFSSDFAEDSSFNTFAPPNYSKINPSGSLLQFNGQDIFNFRIPKDKPFTIKFTSTTDFESFSEISSSGHSVDKNYPNIIITPHPSGSNSILFKIKESIGKITLSNSCNTCENLVFESFATKDSLESIDFLNGYLRGCGPFSEDKSNFNIQSIDLGNGYHQYFVAYCCGLPQDSTPSSCYLKWVLNNVNCSGDETTYDISPVELFCSEDELKEDKWIKTSDTELAFIRRSHFCKTNCSSADVEPLLLVESDPPTTEQLLSICPSFTPNTTTTKLYNFASEYEDRFSSLLVAHEVPYYSSSSCLVSTSEILSSPYPEKDYSSRSFFKESSNGYFYEDELPFLKSENGVEIQGKKFFNTDLIYYGDDYFSFPNFDSFWFADFSTETYEGSGNLHTVVSSGDPPVYTSDFNFIKDLSLFEKVFTHESKDSPLSIINESVASLNFDYWFNELPRSIYSSESWWNHLENEFLPKFTLTLSTNDLSQNLFAFHNNSQELLFDSLFISNSSSSYSGVFLKRLSNLFNLSSFTDFSQSELVEGDFIDNYILEENFIFSPTNPSRTLTVDISFAMKIKESTVSSDILDKLPSLNINREESLTVYIDLPFSYDYNFSNNFGVDKSFGITSPKYNLIENNFINLGTSDF
jgi:hypothetical protein